MSFDEFMKLCTQLQNGEITEQEHVEKVMQLLKEEEDEQ